jgi:hypothetical protein
MLLRTLLLPCVLSFAVGSRAEPPILILFHNSMVPLFCLFDVATWRCVSACRRS